MRSSPATISCGQGTSRARHCSIGTPEVQRDSRDPGEISALRMMYRRRCFAAPVDRKYRPELGGTVLFSDQGPSRFEQAFDTGTNCSIKHLFRHRVFMIREVIYTFSAYRKFLSPLLSSSNVCPIYIYIYIYIDIYFFL